MSAIGRTFAIWCNYFTASIWFLQAFYIQPVLLGRPGWWAWSLGCFFAGLATISWISYSRWGNTSAWILPPRRE